MTPFHHQPAYSYTHPVADKLWIKTCMVSGHAIANPHVHHTHPHMHSLKFTLMLLHTIIWRLWGSKEAGCWPVWIGQDVWTDIGGLSCCGCARSSHVLLGERRRPLQHNWVCCCCSVSKLIYTTLVKRTGLVINCIPGIFTHCFLEYTQHNKHPPHPTLHTLCEWSRDLYYTPISAIYQTVSSQPPSLQVQACNNGNQHHHWAIC